MLKDKKKVISFLLASMGETAKQKEGLPNLLNSLTRENPNHSTENIAKCVSVCLSTEAKQAEMLQALTLICLVQAQSSSFDSDVAQMLVKAGRGEEALKQMFENKLKGR